MKHEQVVLRAGRDSVGMPLVVTELDKQILVVKLLDNSANLATGKPVSWKVCQQSHNVQGRRASCMSIVHLHHNTQAVTNRGTLLCRPRGCSGFNQ